MELRNIPDAKLLHLGKAGGGTVMERFWSFRYDIKYFHPNPPKEIDEYKDFNSLIITLRDPVDRFGSDFYWEALTACRFDQKDEIRHRNDPKSLIEPDKYCKKRPHPRQWEEYEYNASKLAEALCDANGSKAKEKMNQLKHAKHSINDWLFKKETNYTIDDWLFNKKDYNSTYIDHMKEALVAVVSEHDYSFIDQIDSAIEWVLSRTIYNEKNTSSAMQKAFAEVSQAKQKIGNKTKGIQKHSQYQVTLPWLQSPEPISNKGTCCLIRHYYKQDYLLLRDDKFLQVCKGRKKKCLQTSN